MRKKKNRGITIFVSVDEKQAKRRRGGAETSTKKRAAKNQISPSAADTLNRNRPAEGREKKIQHVTRKKILLLSVCPGQK